MEDFVYRITIIRCTIEHFCMEDISAHFFYFENEAFATYEDSPFHTGLMEHTGVNIEWVFPTWNRRAQAFNIMLASDTLPDIIYWGLMKDVERLMEEGVVRDLTDYMAEYSPAYYEF